MWHLAVDKKTMDSIGISLHDFREIFSQVCGEPVLARPEPLSGAEHLRVAMLFNNGEKGQLESISSRYITEAKEARLKGEDYLVKGENFGSGYAIIFYSESTSGISAGLYAFLEEVCGAGFFVDGDNIPKDRFRPLKPFTITGKPRFQYRGYLTHPFWKSPYEFCCRLWRFETWKEQIDWMRRKGLNTLILFHDEGMRLWGDVLFQVFPELKNNTRPQKFVIEPEQRTALNKEIFRYARQSGVNIAYNIMYSQVPDFFRETFPDLTYHATNMNSLGICASQSESHSIMYRFWEKVLATYGTDDSHLYFVCPYQHEQMLCEHFETRAPVMAKATKMLKAIDPQANIYAESWCWKTWYGPGPETEWSAFLKDVPEDVGIIDWDSSFRGEVMLKGINRRRFIQLTHLTMEASYPPEMQWINEQKITQIIQETESLGGIGQCFFNIIARTNPYLCDMAANLCWSRVVKPDSDSASYTVRRFGSENRQDFAVIFDEYLQALSPEWLMPGFVSWSPPYSGEKEIKEKINSGTLTKKWLEEKLDKFKEKRTHIENALALTKRIEIESQTPLIKEHLWQLRYLFARCNGLVALYESWLSKEDNPEFSRKQFLDCARSFTQLQELIDERPTLSMIKLFETAPAGFYTQYFQKMWWLLGPIWQKHTPFINVVKEHIDVYLDYVHDLNPVLHKIKIE